MKYVTPTHRFRTFKATPSLLAVVLAAMCAVPAARTQEPDLAIKIVAPEPETYTVGMVPLKAVIQPPGRAQDIARIMFYADGRLVCTLMDPARAECTWDAGPNITSHVLRAVAEKIGGGRVVTSIRTKGLDLAESINVEVVQVTAVVSDRGRFINGLPQSAFRILEDEVPQKIAHFSSEGSPLEIVVEVHPGQLATAGRRVDDVVDLLSARGFHAYELDVDYSVSPHLVRDRARPRRAPRGIDFETHLVFSRRDEDRI